MPVQYDIMGRVKSKDEFDCLGLKFKLPSSKHIQHLMIIFFAFKFTPILN